MRDPVEFFDNLSKTVVTTQGETQPELPQAKCDKCESPMYQNSYKLHTNRRQYTKSYICSNSKCMASRIEHGIINDVY